MITPRHIRHARRFQLPVIAAIVLILIFAFRFLLPPRLPAFFDARPPAMPLFFFQYYRFHTF